MQGSSLSSSLRLFDFSSLSLFVSLSLSLFDSLSLLPLSPVQQKYLSLEGYTVSNPGQRPGIVGGKERSAWRAVRPRRWCSRFEERQNYGRKNNKNGGKLSAPVPHTSKACRTGAE